MRLRLSMVLVLLALLGLLAGCSTQKETPTESLTTPVPKQSAAEATPEAPIPVEEKPTQPAPEQSGIEAVSYFSLEEMGEDWQAVLVENAPLVYTGQILPLDKQGTIPADLEEQCERLLLNVDELLGLAQSDWDRLVQLHVCGTSARAIALVLEKLNGRINPDLRPALTAVVTPLARKEVQVAIDFVAWCDSNSDRVERIAFSGNTVSSLSASASIVPPGGTVYFSGVPSKKELSQAVTEAVDTLLTTCRQLNIAREQIIRLRVFVQSVQQADQVLEQLEKDFGLKPLPPVVFVEWQASAPVEIEMTAWLPPQICQGKESVVYYNPPEVKPSPNFSRVAIVYSGRQLFLPGLVSAEEADGTGQVQDVFERMKQILARCGSDMQHLAKATYYVCDDDASRALDMLRRQYYDSRRPPAASKAMVSGLAVPSRSVLVDMIAVPVQ